MDETTQAALDILNAAWIAVPLEYRDAAKLVNPDNPLPHAVHLMARALHPAPPPPPKPPAKDGDLYDPDAS